MKRLYGESIRSLLGVIKNMNKTNLQLAENLEDISLVDDLSIFTDASYVEPIHTRKYLVLLPWYV